MSMNEQLAKVMNEQVTHEQRAALLYTQLGYEMDRLSFPGMRDWMFAQAEEEREHAQKFAQHLLDRDERVDIATIEMPDVKVSTPLAAFEAALEHEKHVSELIRQITRVADEAGDLDSRSLLNWFLDEQIEEEASIGEIVDHIRLVGNDGAGLLRIDAKLGARD